jgi:hypothetical protein
LDDHGRTLHVRLLRPFGPEEVEIEGARFSTEISREDADALLCEWAPYDELFDFPGPSAWYTCEPRTNPRMGVLAVPEQAAFLDRLRPEQMLHQAHPDPRYRVPHITHLELTTTDYRGPRRPRAAAVARNHGFPAERRWPEIRLRNAFLTHGLVDLYGPWNRWGSYKRRFLFGARPPRSYRGDPEEVYLREGMGDSLPDIYWPDNPVKVALMARYHAAVCMENSLEPGYFSEKFMDGVRAGCVPVYHAHPSLRDGVLKGAVWVDPADHDHDVGGTLKAALAMDRAEVAEQNYAWLDRDEVRATSHQGVWSAIRDALVAQGEALGR